MITTLDRAMDAGVLRRQEVRPPAHLVFAVLGAAAHFIAHAERPADARAEVEPALLSLLDGLRA